MAYLLTLTYEEQRALGWVADRYHCAEVLYDGMYALDGEDADGSVTYRVPEHVAWEYAEALPLENGVEGAVLPPCVGGMLGEKLVRLLEEIV